MSDHKSSAELEREIEQQRHRIEDRVDELQERLSPGQLVDEALSYARHNGGQEFVGNLGERIKANPLPVALLGVSIAWLMTGSRSAPEPRSYRNYGFADRYADRYAGRYDTYSEYAAYHDLYEPFADEEDVVAYSSLDYEDEEHPLQTAGESGLKRVRHAADETGQWFSEFVDDKGRKFKAASDESGRRAGHFIDDTGKQFRGFVDASGQRITRFTDEAGNQLDEARGWASHNWRKIRGGWHDAGHALAHARSEAGRHAARFGQQIQSGAGQLRDSAGQLRDQAGQLRDGAQEQADRLRHTAVNLFEDQPLIAGALAFAAGAAIGALLPHTRQEDEAFGDASDDVRRQAEHAAADVYAHGKEEVAERYEEAKTAVSGAYDDVKSRAEGDQGTPNRSDIH